MSVDKRRAEARKAHEEHRAGGTFVSLGTLLNGHQEHGQSIKEEIRLDKWRAMMEEG